MVVRHDGRRLTWLAIVAALLATGCSRQQGPVDDLRNRLRNGPRYDTIEVSYRATGTQVLDCALPNRQFDLIVDPSASSIVARRPDTTEVIAERVGTNLQLAPTLFRGTAQPVDGLRVQLSTLADDDRTELERLLGADLATYLLAEELPADGTATALAALDGVDHIDELLPATLDGEPIDTFAWSVDVEEYDSEDSVPPRIEASIDSRGAVRRLAVIAATNTPAAPTGWTVGYRSTKPVELQLRRTGTSIDDINLAQLTPSVDDCELST